VLGHFVPNGAGRLRVSVAHAPGFDGAVLAISGGSAPLAALPDTTCGDSHDLFFTGPPAKSDSGGCTGIRQDFDGSSQQAGGCSSASVGAVTRTQAGRTDAHAGREARAPA
jgi:hypothetical protein